MILFFPRSAQTLDGDGEDEVCVKKKKYNMLYLSAPLLLHSDTNIQLILVKTQMFFVFVIKNKRQMSFQFVMRSID